VVHVIKEDGPYPPPGSVVDSISIYTRDLAEANRELYLKQKRKAHVGNTGQTSTREDNWLINMVDAATEAASTVMDDSELENDLGMSRQAMAANSNGIIRAEDMTSRYGSFGSSSRSTPASPSLNSHKQMAKDDPIVEQVMSFDSTNPSVGASIGWSASEDTERSARLITADHLVSA
jgi:hypothetical protein